MTDQERAELETLRQEVEKQKILVEAYELMLELARERLHVDVKKNYEEMLLAGLLRDRKNAFAIPLATASRLITRASGPIVEARNASVTFFPSSRIFAVTCLTSGLINCGTCWGLTVCPSVGIGFIVCFTFTI